MTNPFPRYAVSALDSRRTPEQLNRIRLREQSARVGGVAIGQCGEEMLSVIANINQATADNLFYRGLWKPAMAALFPDSPERVFRRHLRSLVNEGGLAKLGTVSEVEMTNRLAHSCRMIRVGPVHLRKLIDVAAENNVDPDALANAVAEDSFPDYDAVLADFGVAEAAEPIPHQTLRLV